MTYPSSKVAPTGRAKCIQCGEKVENGTLKVEVERTVQTPRGDRTAAASLHPKCAEAWVEENGWPGGIEAFAQAVHDNGSEPIDALAKHLSADAALPPGDLRKLVNELKFNQPFTPLVPTEEVIAYLDAHRWDFADLWFTSKAIAHGPELVRRVLAKAPPHQEAAVRVELLSHLLRYWDKEEQQAWLHPLAEELADELTVEPGDSAATLAKLVGYSRHASAMSWLRPLLERIAAQVGDVDAGLIVSLARSSLRDETFMTDLRDRAAPAVRVQALWETFLPQGMTWGQGWPPGPALGFLLGNFGADAEWRGRRGVHVGALAGRVDLLEHFADAIDAPLTSLEMFYTWTFGPDDKGDRTYAAFEPEAGSTPAALVQGMIAMIREARERASQPMKPSKKLKQWEEERDPGHIARLQGERDQAVEKADELLERYEAALAALQRLGATIEAADEKPAPAATEAAAAPGGDAGEVELEWLRDHLDDCADDVFDEVLRFQRAYAKDGAVFVDFTITSRGDEPGSAGIEWPDPAGYDDAKVLALIDEIADAQYG